jgi:hypothetical protein
MNNNLKLKFNKIKVSFIYGYVNYDTTSSKEIATNDFSEMWVPVYNLNNRENGFVCENLISDKLVEIKTDDNKKLNAKLSASIIQKNKGGGAGSINISIVVEEKNNSSFDSDTIFNLLGLLPRTSHGEIRNHIECEEINFSLFEDDGNNFSSIFKLFCSLLVQIHPCWSELTHTDLCKDGIICEHSTKTSQPLFDTNSKTDPQIPYILVEGFVPDSIYNSDFIEGRPTKYTNEIGCLLGRWLNSNNVKQLNQDYYRYYEDNDEILGTDNSFISRYRDKKSFIVFSSLLTLILKSDFDYGVKAAELTTNSVVNYLEFSRMRLHNTLWLNKQLDSLVDTVAVQGTTKEILNSKQNLNKLKIKVAKSMNNPMSYMWDSVLGQEIPALRIYQNVEKLENDTIKKLSIISELISDKIQNTQISDFVEVLKTK